MSTTEPVTFVVDATQRKDAHWDCIVEGLDVTITARHKHKIPDEVRAAVSMALQLEPSLILVVVRAQPFHEQSMKRMRES